jgi:hypothetical protein
VTGGLLQKNAYGSEGRSYDKCGFKRDLDALLSPDLAPY